MAETTYLIYRDNGMRLVYAGDDAEVSATICAELASGSVGHFSGYQFVGRQRYELRCFFDSEPAVGFFAARNKRDLFDFSWHPCG